MKYRLYRESNEEALELIKQAASMADGEMKTALNQLLCTFVVPTYGEYNSKMSTWQEFVKDMTDNLSDFNAGSRDRQNTKEMIEFVKENKPDWVTFYYGYDQLDEVFDELQAKYPMFRIDYESWTDSASTNCGIIFLKKRQK